MTQHYFTANPAAKNDKKTFEYTLNGITLSFDTDSGVFSRDGLDEGSKLMLLSLPLLQGSILDLGCGYGAIGLFLAAQNPLATVILADINERAVELCAQNIEKNALPNAQALCSDGFDNTAAQYNHIVTNPPIRAGKKVYYAWFEEAMNRLQPGGSFFAVIRKQQGAESAQKKLQAVFGNCTRIARDGGFWILQCVKDDE